MSLRDSTTPPDTPNNPFTTGVSPLGLTPSQVIGSTRAPVITPEDDPVLTPEDVTVMLLGPVGGGKSQSLHPQDVETVDHSSKLQKPQGGPSCEQSGRRLFRDFTIEALIT